MRLEAKSDLALIAVTAGEGVARRSPPAAIQHERVFASSAEGAVLEPAPGKGTIVRRGCRPTTTQVIS
jgi:hypothetical protein